MRIVIEMDDLVRTASRSDEATRMVASPEPGREALAGGEAPADLSGQRVALNGSDVDVDAVSVAEVGGVVMADGDRDGGAAPTDD
jgi:hypothetical protein